MNPCLPPYKPWLIPAVCSAGYAQCMILLSVHLKLGALSRYLDVDYVSHWRPGSPFETIDNLDALVFWGVQIIYWGLELVLFVLCYNTTKVKTNWRESTSNICIFTATGMAIFYMVLVWCMMLLAVHEGYHPMADTIYRINHGPWHSVSHLGFMVFYELLILAASAFVALGGLLFRFSRQAMTTCFLTIALIWFHVNNLLWLID